MQSHADTEGGPKMDFYNRALELKDETIQNIRNIHKNAEVGLDTPKTKAFVI